MDHGRHSTDAVYIEFTRAFDSVVHSKLIFKLSTFGISENLLYWIAAFFNPRVARHVLLTQRTHGGVIYPPGISQLPYKIEAKFQRLPSNFRQRPFQRN